MKYFETMVPGAQQAPYVPQSDEHFANYATWSQDQVAAHAAKYRHGATTQVYRQYGFGKWRVVPGARPIENGSGVRLLMGGVAKEKNVMGPNEQQIFKRAMLEGVERHNKKHHQSDALTKKEIAQLSPSLRRNYKIASFLKSMPFSSQTPLVMIQQNAEEAHKRLRDRECETGKPMYEDFDVAYQRMANLLSNNTPYDKDAHTEVLVRTLRLLKTVAEVWLAQSRIAELQGMIERCNFQQMQEQLANARSLLATIFTTRPVTLQGHKGWYAETNPLFAVGLMNRLLRWESSLADPDQKVILDQLLPTSTVAFQRYALSDPEHHDYAVYCALHANLQGRFVELESLAVQINSIQAVEPVGY